MPTPPSRSSSRSPTKSANPSSSEDGTRLAKCVMQLQGCSRSQAERLITSGCVQVDGVVVSEPPFRVHGQLVSVQSQGSPLDQQQGQQEHTVLLHKSAQAPSSAQAISTEAQWAHDSSGLRLNAHQLRQIQRLSSLIPIEPSASGLEVYTQDWRIERKLRDSYQTLEHELLADIAGPRSEEELAEALATINKLLRDPRQALPPTQCSLSSHTPERSRLRFAIKGAHPGLVQHLCQESHLPLQALHRTRLGRVNLGQLPVGQWRFLPLMVRF